MNLGTRTIEVSVSEGNLHAELETLFRRYGYIRDDEQTTELRLGNFSLRSGSDYLFKAELVIQKEEVN